MSKRHRSQPGLGRVFLAGVALLLSGCSWFADKEALEEAESLPPLEVPPDLIRPYTADKVAKPVSPGQGAATTDCRCDDRPPQIGEAVLPDGKGVKRLRDARHRWLLVSAEPEQVWPLAKKFLEMRGYRISQEEPALGFMETDWKTRFEDAENTGAPGVRERLRIRLEPGQQAQSTEVYLSQYNSERVESAEDSSGEKWRLRDSDNDRAVEMLNRLARYLAGENVEDAVALSPMKSRLATDGENGSVLVVEAELDKAWRRTAIALDALGFVIEDRDRVNRIYKVYNELSTGKTEEELQHGKPESATVREEYRIHLDQEDSNTMISVRNEAGQIDNSDVAMHLLNLLQAQFK